MSLPDQEVFNQYVADHGLIRGVIQFSHDYGPDGLRQTLIFLVFLIVMKSILIVFFDLERIVLLIIVLMLLFARKI